MKPSSPTPEPFLARCEALADPVRLRLLALLEERELAVSDLGEILQLPQSTVSRHLKVLADLGWVAARGERTANLYRMLNGDLPESARRLWQLAGDEMRGWTALEHDRLRLERRLERRRGEGDFFAGVAAEWDRLRRELYGERFTDEALRALLPANWTVADLACGSGSVAALLAPRVARVVAVDLSPEMLAAARVRLAGNPHRAKVDLRQGALEALPIDDRSCDAALLLLALTHVEDPAHAAREMARILKPGGRAVVVDLLKHDRDEFRRRLGQRRNGFEQEELRSLLEAAGLEQVECATLPTEADSKGPALLLASGNSAAELADGSGGIGRAAAKRPGRSPRSVSMSRDARTSPRTKRRPPSPT